MKYYILLILLFVTSLAKGQTGYYVQKDYRIAKYEDSVISFLIKNKQFDANKTPFQTSDYEGKIYVRKCLDLFNDSTSVLLTRFGSLGSPSEQYWGLFTNDKFLFFSEVNNSRLRKMLRDYDNNAITTLEYYIRSTLSKNRQTTRTVTDEKNKNAVKVSL